MSQDNTLAGSPSPEASEEPASPTVAIPVPTDEESTPNDTTSSVDMGGDSSSVGVELPPLPPPTECEFEVSDTYKTGVANILNELLRASESLALMGRDCTEGLENHLRKEATRYAYTRLCELHKREGQDQIKEMINESDDA